jgi:hypothetical protein
MNGQPAPGGPARQAQCRQLEAEYPGWAVTHGPYGFTATLREDPSVTVTGQSVPAFRACMDTRGAYPDAEPDDTDTFVYLDRNPYTDP